MNLKLRILLIAVVVVLISLLVIIGYVNFAISLLNMHPQRPVTGPITGSITVQRDNVLTYNNSQNLVDYALFGYNLANSTSMNISLQLYTEPPAQRVYLVGTLIGAVNYCVHCFQQSQLEPALANALEEHGLVYNDTSFNFVTLENVSAIPAGSVVIIASGLMPASLLPDSSYAGPSLTGNVTILDMLDNGDTVIYIGQNFSTSIGVGDSIFITPDSTISALGISGIRLQNFIPNGASPALENLYFKRPTFSFSSGTSHQNVSSVNVANGTLIAFSNYPTSGWTNVSGLASDIATVLDSRFWFNRIAYGSTESDISSVNSVSLGTIPVLTLTQQMTAIPNDTEAAAGTIASSYALARIYIYNAGSSLERQVPFRPGYLSNGDVSLPASIGETQTVTVTVSSSSSLNQQTSFLLSIVNLSGNSYGSLPVGFYQKPFTVIHYDSFSIPSGYYIAELQNIDAVPYTAALFHIANVTFTPTLIDFKNSSFAFQVTSARVPLSNVSYTVNINGAFPQSGIVQNGTIRYVLPAGSVEQYGNKTFTFMMFGATYTYVYPYPAPAGISIPPLYIMFAIAAVVVVLLNVILKAPMQDDYYIDVPNFPPTRKVKLKTDKSAIMGVFESVNYAYRWKYMPLTAEEIKNGVSTSIRYENMPIAITLQNTTAVLNRLVNENALVASESYYAPLRWISESHHDIEYLTVFRKLRDYCVQNAMLFTDLDADPHMDMLITKKGAQAHVIIYSSTSGMKDVALNNAYRIYIVFLSEVQKFSFLGRLYNSYGEEAELLKMGIEYSYIVLIDTGNLDQLIV